MQRFCSVWILNIGTKWNLYKEVLALSIWVAETKTWCLLLMLQTGERFSAITLHCSCLNVTSCHLYWASYLWRIGKLHLQTTKWTQKCKVHSLQIFCSVLACCFFALIHQVLKSTHTGVIACIRCTIYSTSRCFWAHPGACGLTN